MPREITRHIEKQYMQDGTPYCLIPTCKNTARRKKSGRYTNYCTEHNFRDMMPFTSWSFLAAKILKRDNYTCKKCGFTYDVMLREGKLQVDHIIEVAAGGDMWDESNLQTLCDKCHMAKTKEFLSNRKNIENLRSGKQKDLNSWVSDSK